MANTLMSKDFKSENVVFSNKTEDLNEGGTITSTRISYRYPDGEGRMLLQTARMIAPFGIVNGEKFNNPDKWSIQLSFRGEDSKKSVKQFHHVIDAIDECIIQEASRRPKELVQLAFDDDDDEKYRSKLIRKSYKSKMSKPKEGKEEFGATLRVAIPWDKTKNAPKDYIKFYDKDNKETDWSAVTKGCEIICLLSVESIWTSGLNNTYGPTIKLVQAKVCSAGHKNKIDGFAIKSEDAEEGETSVDEDIEDTPEGGEVEEEVVDDNGI